MSLYHESFGQGPELVLIHGWGMNGDVWEGVIPKLSDKYRVTIIDLPGHGRSVDNLGDYSLDDLSQQIAAVLPDNPIVIGWSLGGMMATHLAATRPTSIKALVLVASAPKFVRDDTWQYGIDAQVLDSFAGDLKNDFKQTVKRFIAIQAMGSDHAREEQRTLRERVFRHGNPQIAALEGGLKLLQTADLRPCLAEIQQPTLLITGQHDSLFRRSAAEATQQLLANARLAIISGAGHAPFLSHPDIFLQALNNFLSEQ